MEDSSGPPQPLDSLASAEKHGKDDLEDAKLRLEIAELRRSQWTKPSVVVPIAAALVTLGISQYLGVFDVERKRVELSAREAEMKRQELQQDLAKLEGEKADLLREKKNLEDRKEGLGRDVSHLESEVTQLKLDTKGLRLAEQRAHGDADRAKKQLEHTRNVLARPELNFTTEILLFEKKAMISMTNRGQGRAVVRVIRPYVDGKRMETGPENQPYHQTLTALGLTASWIRWYWALRTLSSGETTPILMIEPSEFTKERAEQFETATDKHFGLEVCYCSELGDCYWATRARPPITTNSCDVP